jgi:ABC-type Mn2+/Zn2+ transport system permease subunit
MIEVLAEPFAVGPTRRALVEVLVLGAVCGPLGVWILLMRHSYAAESLAHAMLPGLVLAALAGLPLVLGAGGGIVLGAALIALAGRDRRVGGDLGVAVAITALTGLGAMLALLPEAPARLAELLFGDLLALSSLDIALSAALAVIVLAVLRAAHRPLALAAFDPGTARALGTRPSRADLLVLVLLALTVAVTVRALGSLLAVALLLAPAATALRLADRLPAVTALAAALAVLSGVLGLYLSHYGRVAAGASVALVAVALFAVSLAAGRGSAGRRRAGGPVEALGEPG